MLTACNIIVGSVMPSVGTIWNEAGLGNQQSAHNGLLVLAVMIMAMAFTPGFASGPSGALLADTSPGSRGLAVAGARIVEPFSITQHRPTKSKSDNIDPVLIRRTTVRDCDALLGADHSPSTTGPCDLRLVELQ